jgi:hypothetical protein
VIESKIKINKFRAQLSKWYRDGNRQNGLPKDYVQRRDDQGEREDRRRRKAGGGLETAREAEVWREALKKKPAEEVVAPCKKVGLQF